MKTDRQVLEEAIELIDDPRKWIKKSFARNKSGLAVDSLSRYAVSWCAIGALRKATGARKQENTDQIERISLAILGTRTDVMYLNDDANTLHGDVILMMKRGLNKVGE
jgi:hypothetical protein